MLNVRDQVTQRIIEALEAGTPPWRKGWDAMEAHFNASTGKPYQGINQILLGMSGFSDPRWLTMKQANAMKSDEHPDGLRVKKGEKATMIVRMVEVARGSKDDAADVDVVAEDQKTRLVMKAFWAFNGSQIEGMQPLPSRQREMPPIEAVEQVIDGLKADGLSVLHGGDRASYVPKLDTIKMPEKGAFHSPEDYHATLLHEAAHATGAKKRLDRFGLFGNLSNADAYAREELRAELASAMLGAELGIPQGQYHIDNHAAYLASWLQALKNDKNEIFKAASAAQKISDWLRSHAIRPEVNSNEEMKTSAKAMDVGEAVNEESIRQNRGSRMGRRM
jgi:antirestriction protein ArdC